MKKSLGPLIATVIIWFLMYYYILPPLNLQSKDFWSFIIMMVIAAVFINMWSKVKETFNAQQGQNGQINNKEAFRPFKTQLYIIGAVIAVFVVGGITSSTIFRAGAYHRIISVEQSNFKSDITEVNYSQIPVLDRDSAALLGEREMGNMADMVSQYEVNNNYLTQINFRGKPVRVAPLRYGGFIKWITNRKTGIPAYMMTDMTTQDVDCVRLQDGIKISPSEYFNRNLTRYLRFNYPTYMFRSFSFELDEDGVPYWICSVETHTIGLFGGIDIQGAVILNAITGEHVYYDIKDMPTWVDAVYDASLLVQQYDYYGTLKNGFLNSIFGQRDCLQTTEGYNYIALSDDVWVYTGITSVGQDESTVGFVLMNQRTKETNYYPIAGAKEYSAMSSAQGQVQHLGYVATFPILLNVGGEPTYFMALKDAAGLVKMYAMVNIQKYQIVATGDTVTGCDAAYRALMIKSGITATETVYTDEEEYSGVISEIKSVVTGGDTYYYLIMEGRAGVLFEVAVGENIGILLKSPGDSVSFRYLVSEDNSNLFTVTKILE